MFYENRNSHNDNSFARFWPSFLAGKVRSKSLESAKSATTLPSPGASRADATKRRCREPVEFSRARAPPINANTCMGHFCAERHCQQLLGLTHCVLL